MITLNVEIHRNDFWLITGDFATFRTHGETWETSYIMENCWQKATSPGCQISSEAN